MTISHPLIELFGRPQVNSFRGLSSVVSRLIDEGLGERFEQQRAAAPHRHPHRKYFVGHTGGTSLGSPSNRREEHLAICLWSAYRQDGFMLPDGTRLFPLDYQFPLKSCRGDTGVGKVDLFCVEDCGQPWVVELKVHPRNEKHRVETPLKATLEGLAYSAVVDANLEDIRRESLGKQECAGRCTAVRRPNLLILAPDRYWAKCKQQEASFPWMKPMADLRTHLANALGIQTMFVELQDCEWNYPGPGKLACFSRAPTFRWADEMTDPLTSRIPNIPDVQPLR